MKQRIALFLSVVLTAFALVTVGGVITSVQGASQVTETPVVTEEAAITPTIDPSLEEAINQREAAFQDLINQANARIAEDQKIQMELQAQVAALQSAQAPSPEMVVGIAPEDAASIAAGYMGKTDLYAVEATSLYGSTVYKVTFSSGDIVYVGLDGQVIGVAPAQLAASDDSGGGGGGHDRDDDDHEDHEDEHEDD